VLSQESRDPSESEVVETTPSAMLGAFIATNPGARRVGETLKSSAEVAIRFVDQPGDWRLFVEESGKVRFEPVKATDPDFELYMPTAAVSAITSHIDADVGKIGIEFFEHILAREPSRQIGVKVYSGFVKLTRRGWVGVLALGGSKLLMWMAGKGLRGPGAIANALSRLKG
jgi:hypothetical protein